MFRKNKKIEKVAMLSPKEAERIAYQASNTQEMYIHVLESLRPQVNEWKKIKQSETLALLTE